MWFEVVDLELATFPILGLTSQKFKDCAATLWKVCIRCKWSCISTEYLNLPVSLLKIRVHALGIPRCFTCNTRPPDSLLARSL